MIWNSLAIHPCQNVNVSAFRKISSHPMRVVGTFRLKKRRHYGMTKPTHASEELLASHCAPPHLADRGRLARYGWYLGNKIPEAD
jgi:hypothetical protein